MSATEDQADVEKVLTRDISAFEGIVRRWQGPPVNLAYRFCGDCGRAEEMAQEASLRCLPRARRVAQRFGGFQPGSLRWPRTCTVPNFAGSLPEWWRSMILRNPAIPALPTAARRVEIGTAPCAGLCLVFLPKCREALVLSYFHGMDVAPLRKASACPEGTVKARLSRGREILRNKLQQILRTPRLKEEEAR